MVDAAHEVFVLCDCGDVEHCQTEIYVSDVRLLERQYRLLLEGIERVWSNAQLVVSTT